MNKRILALVVWAVTLLGAFVSPSRAQSIYPGSHADAQAAWFASRLPWHGGYYHHLWGRPVPMVVPPNAAMYTQFNWGVSTNEMRPIYHQFGRRYPGEIAGGGETSLLGAPYHPSSTRQAGVYYIRAPW